MTERDNPGDCGWHVDGEDPRYHRVPTHTSVTDGLPCVARSYPKKNGKLRPLGIPTWSDKLLQEVMRSILDAYYEPQFSPTLPWFPAGARMPLSTEGHLAVPGPGQTGSSREISKGVSTTLTMTILLSILREKIHDGRFLNLVENLLKAGYLEAMDLSTYPQRDTARGDCQSTPRKYLPRQARQIRRTDAHPRVHERRAKRKCKEYQSSDPGNLAGQSQGATEGDLKPLRRKFRPLGASDPFDPNYRRLRYIRYADDFLLGFDGPRDEAEEIKTRLGTFLRDHLKLELSPEKTLITHARTEKARFLGYDISTYNKPGLQGHGNITLRIPPQVIKAKAARYMAKGKPAGRPELIDDSDLSIVGLYGSEYRGYTQYYA